MLHFLIMFVGQFHPVIVHFPVAMLLVAALAEAIHLLRPKRFLIGVAAFNLHIGAIGAVVASVMGWCLATTQSFSPDLVPTLFWHRWLGTGVTVLALLLVALWWKNRIRPSRALLFLYRLLLISGAGVVAITGHLGGSLVYGLDWYQWTMR
jgi:uncharacterized membrane protein